MPLGSSGLDNSPTTSRRLIIPKPLSPHFHIYFIYLCISMYIYTIFSRNIRGCRSLGTRTGRGREGCAHHRGVLPALAGRAAPGDGGGAGGGKGKGGRGAPSSRRDAIKPDSPASQSARPGRMSSARADPRRDPLDGSRRTWGGTGHTPPSSGTPGPHPPAWGGGDTLGVGGREGWGSASRRGCPGGIGPRCPRGHAWGCGRGRGPRRGVEVRGADPQRRGEGFTRPHRNSNTPGRGGREGGADKATWPTRGCPRRSPPRLLCPARLSVPALCLGRGVCTSGLFISCKFFVRRP